MMHVTRIGGYLAKHVFQLHGVDERGYTVLRRRLSRTQVCAFFAQLRPCLVGIEACGSAPYWACTLRAQGHDVRLIAPQFVAPYRKNDKNDGNDAEAICEAVGRPHMRVVPIKDVAQQAVLTVHRARQLLVAERTALVNQTRGLLAEYGLIVPTGVGVLRRSRPGAASTKRWSRWPRSRPASSGRCWPRVGRISRLGRVPEWASTDRPAVRHD